jgi:hypothetical protein
MLFQATEENTCPTQPALQLYFVLEVLQPQNKGKGHSPDLLFSEIRNRCTALPCCADPSAPSPALRPLNRLWIE